MRIIYEQQFAIQLKAIVSFIDRDNPAAARSFRNNLKHRIEQLPDNPLACRQSIYFTDSNLRDLIFMGYTAIFRISADEIRLLDIFKWQER
jgi:plasmid stabilization system protein ParE